MKTLFENSEIRYTLPKVIARLTKENGFAINYDDKDSIKILGSKDGKLYSYDYDIDRPVEFRHDGQRYTAYKKSWGLVDNPNTRESSEIIKYSSSERHITMPLYVGTSTYGEKHYDSDEPYYSSWSEILSFGVEWVSTRNKRGELFNVNFEVEVGMKVYVVYGIYSMGDSFGSSEGNGEVIHVFKDEALAKDAVKVIEANKNLTSFNIKIDNNETRKIHVPWGGYFEVFNHADYGEFIVV